MSDSEAPNPAVPPPLPPAAPVPVLPVLPGPYYRPPEFFEVPAPSSGGAGWLLWGVGGVIVLMIGLGAGFLVAVRSGPTRAAAKAAPVPAWMPATPPRVIAPSPAPIRVAPTLPALIPPVKLPTER